MIRQWLRRAWYLVNRRRFEQALREEMDAHRELMREPRRFGNDLRLREQVGDVWGWTWLDELGRDLVCAARQLRRSPAFTIGAAGMLSLGVGLNLAVFQIMNASVFRPLPVRDLASLVRFTWDSKDGRSRNVPYRAVTTIRARGSVSIRRSSTRWGFESWPDDRSGTRTRRANP